MQPVDVEHRNRTVRGFKMPIRRVGSLVALSLIGSATYSVDRAREYQSRGSSQLIV